MVEALISAPIIGCCYWVAVIMVANQWVPCGVGVNNRPKLRNDVLQHLFALRLLSRIGITWLWNEVRLGCLVSAPCCFVCSKCHVALALLVSNLITQDALGLRTGLEFCA